MSETYNFLDMIYVFLLAGIAKGIIIGLIISKMINKKKIVLSHEAYSSLTTQINDLKVKSLVTEEKQRDSLKNVETLSSELKIEREKVINLSSQLSAKTTEAEIFKNRIIEQQQEFEQIKEMLKTRI